MSREKLTIEEQISVLKEAKMRYETGAHWGMCICIQKSLNSFNIHLDSNKNINRYVPTFTFHHICKLTKGTKLFPSRYNSLKESKEKHSEFWWGMYDVPERIKVFKLLIKELEDKLKEI